jgi:hypothetical protein
MYQKLIHIAFIASFLAILIGFGLDQNKIGELYSNSKNKIEKTQENQKLELKVDFSTTLDVLGDFVENILHKLLVTGTNDCCCDKIKKVDSGSIS